MSLQKYLYLHLFCLFEWRFMPHSTVFQLCHGISWVLFIFKPALQSLCYPHQPECQEGKPLQPFFQVFSSTRNITEGDEYPQLVPDNIHMYEKLKGPQLIKK